MFTLFAAELSATDITPFYFAWFLFPFHFSAAGSFTLTFILSFTFSFQSTNEFRWFDHFYLIENGQKLSSRACYIEKMKTADVQSSSVFHSSQLSTAKNLIFNLYQLNQVLTSSSLMNCSLNPLDGTSRNKDVCQSFSNWKRQK